MPDAPPGAAPIDVLAPTWLEYLAARRALPATRVVHAGLRLARWRGAPPGTAVIVCGLAGALDRGLATGTVLIPETVGLTDGTRADCDPDLVAALARGARDRGFAPEHGPLLTAPEMITGAARAAWAARGFVATDMETGLLAGRGLRFAAVRVILDTPERDVSPVWISPGFAVLNPAYWAEGLWLLREAPACARKAAAVVRAGLALWTAAA